MGSAVLGKIELSLLELPTAKRLVPLFSVGLLTLVFNTLCLRNVDASFFQVRSCLFFRTSGRSFLQIARGLLLPFTIAVAAAYTHHIPGRPSLFAAVVVTIGFFVGLSPSSYFISTSSLSNAVPAIYGCLSALLTAVHAVLMKPAHDIVGSNSVIKLAYWGNLVIALALIPFIVFNGELEPLLKNHDRDWSVFIAGSAVTGLFGFFLSVAGLLSVKVTSPITHMFSSVGVVFALKFFYRWLNNFRSGCPKCDSNYVRSVNIW
jgi:solute carrier family 35 (GDP-fucose transporter), member C1